MPLETLLPNERGLIAGFHGPQIELDFVDDVYGKIRETGYGGGISLVGSRSEGKWITADGFNSACLHLHSGERIQWYNVLNGLARVNQFSRAEMPKIIEFLRDPPQDIINFLAGDPGSDYDLLIKAMNRPQGIFPYYTNKVLGQSVDVYVLGEQFRDRF